MPTLSSSQLGETYRSDLAWSILEELTAIGNRMSGQAGEAAAADRLETRFEALGFEDVETTAFELPGWWRESASLAVEDPHPRRFDDGHELIALPGTPSCDLEAEVVDLGYGLPSDFERDDLEGTLVMVSTAVPESAGRWIHRQEKYANAVAAGAAGFLFRAREPGGIPPTGFISFGEAGGEIPGAGVSRETGDRLRRIAESGSRVELTIDARIERTTSQNIEAVLGPATDREVVVGAHYDAHDVGEGAGDNGCGVAILLEVARLLAAHEADLETRVRLVAFGAEEAGMLGAEHWAATHEGADVKCVLNLDGIGDSRTLRLYPHGFDGIEAAVEAACEDLGEPCHTESGIFAHGDQWPFVRRGLPGAMLGSGKTGRFAHAHTHADTIEKIDRRDLRDLAICAAECVLRVASADRTFDHTSPAAIRERMDPATRESLERQGREH